MLRSFFTIPNMGRGDMGWFEILVNFRIFEIDPKPVHLNELDDVLSWAPHAEHLEVTVNDVGVSYTDFCDLVEG